jgi:replicative DNA helicase
MEQGIGRAVPPHSLEAERSVLGAMMQDPAAVMLAVEMLKEEDFYAPAHRELFSAMRTLHLSGSPVDLVTADSELSRRGTLEGIGGTAYLIEVSQYVPTTANVKAYIGIVSEKSTLRKLISASQQISAESYSQQDPVPDILNHAEKAIFDIVMRRASGEALVRVDEILTLTYEKIEELARLKGQINGVPTGFYDLDNLLTGMHPGEFVLIGARPSMGKTSLAMNIAQHACLNKGKTTAVFSLEMPREQIVMRMLCSEARINLQKVRSGTLKDEDWMKLAKVLGPIAASPLYIDDTAGLTPTQLRSRCRRLMMDKGLDLIIVDYLQLMGSDKKTENRQLEVSEISRQLKNIALELKVPLVACAQLSRALASRQDKRPVLSDLRDSGSIEQDADVVMFIHREGYYNMTGGEEDNMGEIILAKQRNGPLGTVKVGWFSEYATYTNPAGFDAP